MVKKKKQNGLCAVERLWRSKDTNRRLMWVACAATQSHGDEATQSHGDVRPELLLRTMSESVVLLYLRFVLSVSHVTKWAHSIHVYWNPWAMMSCLHPSLTLGDLVLHPFRRTAPTPHRRVGSASHEKAVPPHIPSSAHPTTPTQAPRRAGPTEENYSWWHWSRRAALPLTWWVGEVPVEAQSDQLSYHLGPHPGLWVSPSQHLSHLSR